MESNTLNFIMGGKLGDFIQSLITVKGLCSKYNKKANLYMCDIGWDFGINNVYKELYPIIMYQEYINDFKILQNYYLDPIQTPSKNTPIQIFDEKIIKEGYIDLGSYIRSPYLYKNCWSEIFSKTFDFSIYNNNKWIDYNKINDLLIDKILIHRKHTMRTNNSFPYNNILNEYKDNLIFISSNEKDYENFPYKSNVPFLKMETLDDWFTSINSCYMIISNLTGPAAIAHAIDKLRIIELPENADAYHCIGEEKYSNNVHWYVNDLNHNLI
jgi:hypothetical protein